MIAQGNPRQFLHCQSQGSFRNAAGISEEYAGSCSDLIRIIIVLCGDVLFFNAFHFKHFEQFQGIDDRIHIRNAIRGEFGAFGFILLGDAWDHGNNEQVFLVNAAYFGKVALDRRSHHHLRRFAGRQMRDDFWIAAFHEVYPTRTAGGELRHDTAAGYTSQELIGFFQNGQIGGEGIIEYFLEAQPFQHARHEGG
ncbi:hypothetical protein SDC9_134434 [bioreactor metagenome]|uniref:Uncharacterized protein n=1 Tax=bioreactor metagenome TaxID=1076179 RepID=A0A645DE65_9ZZZZ